MKINSVSKTGKKSYDKPRQRNAAKGKGPPLEKRIVNIGDPNRTILENKK
jgi:hypothetical protein